jgi:hypothetical protein
VNDDLARLYHVVMRSFVETGRAPQYVDIARAMDIEPDRARSVLHELTSMRLPNWLSPGTDLIASFAPFSSIPNRYPVAVDGDQRWFAQCGFESLSLGHLFPGRSVEVASTCLDCDEPLRVQLRDATLVALEPSTMVAYSKVPLADWYPDIGRS